MIEGRIRLLGDDINTDLLSPSKGMNGEGDIMERVRKYTLIDLDPTFAPSFVEGSIIVAGSNFGCGSSREGAATVLIMLGAGAVIAESFARIFFRNAINIGLPIFEAPTVKELFTQEGQVARIEPEKGLIVNVTTGRVVHVAEMPEEIQQIIDMGGLMPYVEYILSKQE